MILATQFVMFCFVWRYGDDLISTLEMFVRSYKEVPSTEPDVSQLLVVSLFMRLGAARRGASGVISQIGASIIRGIFLLALIFNIV